MPIEFLLILVKEGPRSFDQSAREGLVESGHGLRSELLERLILQLLQRALGPRVQKGASLTMIIG
eukprot:2506176-Pyramimonas_sp.AAC.1